MLPREKHPMEWLSDWAKVLNKGINTPTIGKVDSSLLYELL